MTGPPAPVLRIGVVVPAHDEEEWLPSSLAALRAAAVHPSVAGRSVDLVVALDACTDGSAAAATAAGARLSTVEGRGVGAARAAGFAAVLAGSGDPARCWLATTDADTLVAPDWLARQVAYADRGADAVVGTVRVTDWSEHSPRTARRFRRRYGGVGDEHPHVHGANLGLRGSAYLDVGGMPPLPLAEDHAIVAALVAAGHRVVRTRSLPVVTSARRRARAPGGFADHLAALGGDAEAAVSRRTA